MTTINVLLEFTCQKTPDDVTVTCAQDYELLDEDGMRYAFCDSLQSGIRLLEEAFGGSVFTD